MGFRVPGCIPHLVGRPGLAPMVSGSVRATYPRTSGGPIVNFAFSDEQEQLRDAVRRFLESKSPSSEVRRLMETTEGYDPAVWKQMANELGLQSIHIPEEYGGQGFTFVELAIVLEEMGRVLLCAPYFSSVVLAAASTSRTSPPVRSVTPAADGRRSPRRSTRQLSVSRTRWSAARRKCSRCRLSTPRCGCSSGGRSARSRRSSTSAPTCCSKSSRGS